MSNWFFLTLDTKITDCMTPECANCCSSNVSNPVKPSMHKLIISIIFFVKSCQSTNPGNGKSFHYHILRFLLQLVVLDCHYQILFHSRLKTSFKSKAPLFVCTFREFCMWSIISSITVRFYIRKFRNSDSKVILIIWVDNSGFKKLTLERLKMLIWQTSKSTCSKQATDLLRKIRLNKPNAGHYTSD